MCEIKFRAYDKIDKRMLYRTIWDRNWYATPNNDEGGCHCVRGITPDDRPRLILMQYADLNDKDGKPLDWWEGDIIVTDGETLFEITLEDGCFWAKGLQAVDIDIPHKELLCTLAQSDYILTVRGNRYEHPELLKQKGG